MNICKKLIITSWFLLWYFRCEACTYILIKEQDIVRTIHYFWRNLLYSRKAKHIVLYLLTITSAFMIVALCLSKSNTPNTNQHVYILKIAILLLSFPFV